MPELPEVETTKRILNKLIKGLVIKDVWTNYYSLYFKNKENIKDPSYFARFKKEIVGRKIIGVERIGKNILINLSGENTILAHMKMTGHFLYGKYAKTKSGWKAVSPRELKDPMNRFVRFLLVLSDEKHLAFSDMRKFAKICLLETGKEIKDIGIDALAKSTTFNVFLEQIKKKKKWYIKTALMNQSLIAGIGNIYSDEILWASKIHPERKIRNVQKNEWRKIFANIKKILKKGITVGGDSMSDFRNPYGQKGGFQHFHKVYKRKNERCLRKNCEGIIERKVVNSRSAHFCPMCQK